MIYVNSVKKKKKSSNGFYYFFIFYNLTEAIKTNLQSYGLLVHYTPISTFMGVLVRTTT